LDGRAVSVFEDTTIQNFFPQRGIDLPCAMVRKPAKRRDLGAAMGIIIWCGVGACAWALVLFWLFA
jgi:hypothetical protein